jgi:hypothetical protein
MLDTGENSAGGLLRREKSPGSEEIRWNYNAFSSEKIFGGYFRALAKFR